MLAMQIIIAPIWSIVERDLNVSRFIDTSPKRNSLDQMESKNRQLVRRTRSCDPPTVTLIERPRTCQVSVIVELNSPPFLSSREN
jgi:hypothetical protein